MLVQCPDCKKEVSHTAKFCPHCGSTKRWYWEGMAARSFTKELFTSAQPALAANPPAPSGKGFRTARVLGLTVLAVLISSLLYAVAKNFASMGDLSVTTNAAPEVAPFDRAAVWKAGFMKGEELGAIAGHAGWGAPKPAALDLVARNNGDKSGYLGAARDHWETALKAGYQEAHQEITKTKW